MGAWTDLGEPYEDDGLERVKDYRDADDEGTDPPADRLDGDSGLGLETQAPEQDGDEFDEDGAAQPWAQEMGFPDQHGVVRVWVDDDALIERVRLSLHWRTRLGDQPLEESFAAIFMLINNFHRLRQRRAIDFYDGGAEAAEALSWDALNRLREREAEIRRQIQALGEDGHSVMQGEPTIGQGQNGRVQLKLNLVGQLAGVRFDPAWILKARIKDISDGVVQAHADARARFVPGEYIVGERERLTNELAGLRSETLALMRRGFY